MNFHSMKRKQLQALCKKHKIPANLSNLELANKLTEFFKEKEDPSIQRPIQRDDEYVSETESSDVVVNRKVRKVRFSPDHELIEFTRSPEVKRRSRRNTVFSKYSSLSVEKLDSGEMNKENLGEQGRATRSRGLNALDGKVNEKKRGINAVKCNNKISKASAIEIFDNGKLKEGYVHSSGGETLLREKKFAEGEKNASKRGNQRTKDVGKIDEKALDNVDNEKLIEELVDNPRRVTRSRVQKSTEVSAREDKRGRKVVKRNNVALVTAETEENRVAGMSSFVDRRDFGEGKLTRDLGEKVKRKEKAKEEVLENTKIAGERDVTNHQVILRRSKRNTNRVADLEILNVDKRKRGNGDNKGLRQTSNLLASNGETGSEVDLGKSALLKTEELIKVETRKSSRRKNVIESDELKPEIENRLHLRSSVPSLGTAPQPTGVMRRSRRKTLRVELICADEEIVTDLAVENLEVETETKRPLRSLASQLGTAGEVSKDQKNVFQPTGVARRARRKPLSQKLVTANEEIDIDSTVQHLEAEKQESEPCVVEHKCSAVQKNTRGSRRRALKSPRLVNEVGGDSIIHQMDKVMKRKRDSISGGDVLKPNNDSSFVSETMKESNSKKAKPAAATAEVADTRKRTCRLNNPKVSDASSHNDLEIKEPSVMNAKLSESEYPGSTSNLGFSTETSANAIIIDVGLTSERKTHKKKSGISVADTAESSDMKLINGKELASSDTKATSGKKELKTDFEDQVSASNIKGVEMGYSPLEIEQNITDMNKSDPGAQVLSQTKDSGFHNNIDNQGLNEGSNVSGEEGFAETSSSADRLFLGTHKDIKSDLEVAEVEADKCLHPNSSVVDHVGEVKGISVHENLDSNETGQETDVLPEGLNVSGKEGFAESTSSADSLLLDQTDINTDLEVADGEANTCSPPSPNVGDHVGEVEGISVQENLDFDETRQDSQVLPVDSNVSGKESFMETGSLANGLLLGDQTDIKTDLEVSVAESDIFLQPSPSGVDIQGISVQENLDSVETREENKVLPRGSNVSGNEAQLEGAEAEGDKSIFVQEILDSYETRQANDISSPVSCHRIDVDHLESSSNILDKNIDDTSPKVEKVEGFESPVRSIEYTHSKRTFKIKAPSSCMQRRLEGDDMAEGNEAFFQTNIALELAETNEDGCLRINKSASSLYSEFSMPDLSDGERSVGMLAKDICTGKHSVMSSDKQGRWNDSLTAAPITICTDSAEINLVTHEADHTPKGEETYINKSINVEDGEPVEGGSSKSDKSKCGEDGDFSVSNEFDAEGKFGIIPQVEKVISGEYFIKDCNKQGIIHCSPSVAATDLIAEGNDALTYNVKQSELVDANESGCLKSHKSSQDEDREFSISKLVDSENIDAKESGCLKNDRSSKDEGWELSVSNLFDSGRTARISPQDRGIVSAEYSIKNCNEEVMFPEFHSVSTTSAIYNEIKFSADSSNFQQISPAVSESQEQPIQRPESWSNASETAGHAMSLLKTNAEGNISQVVEGTDEDANGSKCGKDIENSAGPCITDVKISMDCTINKLGVEGLTDMKFQLTEETEQQTENLTRFSDIGEDPSSPSWTEMGLHNIFGTTLEDDTPSGLNDAATQGTEMENLTFYTNKSISSNRRSLIKDEEKEEGEMSECAKIINENVVSSTTFSEVLHTRFDVDMEENQLARPINLDENCSHDRNLEKTVISSMGFSDTTKENTVTENISNEKVQNVGCELENSFYLGDPLLSDNGKDVNCEELNEIESVELMNTTTAVLSGSEYNGFEASEQQMTKNTGECLKETNLITEEDKGEKVNPVGGSCLNDEALNNENEWTEKNIISSSDSPRILDKRGCCVDMITDTALSGSPSCEGEVQHHLKLEGEMTQISEVAFKLSDSDIEKSNNVPEKKSHDLNACSDDCNILGETSIERGPLCAEIAYCQNVEIDKGTSPCHFSKVSPDYDEVAERRNSIKDDDDTKSWDETDANSRSCQDVADEPHINNKVVILELQGTSKEAKETKSTTQILDNILAPAEHGSSVRCALSGTLSSSALHLLLGDHENGDIEKPETRTPVFSFKDDHEKNGDELEESSEATTVHFSIPQLHFEEKVEDFKNYSHSISEVPSSGCDEILNESDVADTIKEYIDSESSLSMIFENTGVSLGENSSSCLKEEDVVDRPANSEGEDDKPSFNYFETERKELEEPMWFNEPSSVDFLAEGSTVEPLAETKGIGVKLDSEKQIESEEGSRSSSKQSCPIAKKNARTILIHGTPGKLLTMADMKENAPTRKSSNAGDLTAVRPAKRRALQDVHWK